MQLPIPEHVRELWEAWNLRGCIILSLVLQAFLVAFASARQRRRSALLVTLTWAAYLLADWVAVLAIGLITQLQGQPKSCQRTNGVFSLDLAAFWASFLLLHLGGPDTITAFALEDNEFWLRHFFSLVLQVLAAGYSIYLTLGPENNMWPPMILIFLAGIVKYAERTRALYLASLDRFGSTALPKADPGPDYEEALTTYYSRLLEVPSEAEMTVMADGSDTTNSGDPNLDFDGIILKADDEINLLKVASKLFERFKGIIVGFFLAIKDRESSRNLFLKADYKSAFRLIENELSFMFQVLHTKVVVSRTRTGYVLRGFSFLSLIGASIHFFLLDKKGYDGFETDLTYALLIGGIMLELISIIKLFVSDWTFLVLNERLIRHIPRMFLRRTKWSRLVSQYNMISYCVEDPPKWVYKLAGFAHASVLVEKVKVMWYSTSDSVTDDLEKFVFEEVKRKAKEAETMREALEASLQRGDSALSRSSFATYIKLKWSIGEFQYAESLLLWHVATEICCCQELKGLRMSKVLSDYMFYLLIMQPTMLSPILGNWYIVFMDTSAEANRFFEKHSIRSHSEAMDKLVSVKAKYRPAAVKGLRSKSVFFDSCILAHQLRQLGNEQWEVMDRVWVEFMCYAAVNCRPIVHAQQPSRGGELLTFTWLLMSHFGLGLHFSEQEEQVGTKMVAVK